MFSCVLRAESFSRLYVDGSLSGQYASGLRRYYAVVPLEDIPDDWADWLDVNAREATDKGKVPKAIRETLMGKPEWFAPLNRGLTVVAKQIDYDNKTRELTIKFDDRLYHGVMDGGHTLKAILDTREDLGDIEQVGHCNVEIFTGLDEEEIPAVVESRNTSRQVASKSLTNLQGGFDGLKGAIGAYQDEVSWIENDKGDMDVRELIGILTALDPSHGETPPVFAYSGKEKCLQLFRENAHRYQKLYPIARDALQLWDAIQYYLPDDYNKKGAEPGIGGKFGRLTGVTQSAKKPKRLPFIGKSTEYSIPTGYLYPVLSAFRAMLVDRDGQWAWVDSIDPIKLIKQGMATDIFNYSVRGSIHNYRNPNRTGKDSQTWNAAYMKARIMYLESASR